MYYLEIPGKIASATTFLSQIPNIIIAIGIWLTVYSAYDKNTDNISAAGISMIKVMSIISYVFSIISFIGFIILDIVLIVRIVNYYNELRDFYDLWGISGYASGTTLILPIVLLVIITACLGFRCFFRRKVIHTANSFKCAIIDNSILYPSLLVQVMCFISAIGSAFTAILGSASMWFSVAAYIGFGILISQFREILRRFSSQNAMMYK